MPFVAADGTILRGNNATQAYARGKASAGNTWRRFIGFVIVLAGLAVLFNPPPESFNSYFRSLPNSLSKLRDRMCVTSYDNHVFFTIARCGGKRYLGLLGMWCSWPRLPLLEASATPRSFVLDDQQVLVGLNICVFLLWMCAPFGFMTRHFTISRQNLEQGRVHTLITAGWSHMDLPHLILNLMSLVSSAQLLLEILPGKEFWGLYLTCILGGCVVSTLAHSGDFSSLGASGGAFGLLAYLASARPEINFVWYGFQLKPLQVFVLHLLFEWLHERSTTDVAMHIGGAVTGALYQRAVSAL